MPAAIRQPASTTAMIAAARPRRLFFGRAGFGALAGFSRLTRRGGRFLLRLFRGRGRVRQLRRLAGEFASIEQLGREELVVEIFLARIGILHEREEVADLHLHAGRELRRLEVDVDDGLALGQGIVHLLAAVVRAQVRRGQKRQHELRALEMRRDALRPLAAGLDALIVPDAKAARL